MRSLFVKQDVAMLQERLNRLTVDAKPKWGSFDVNRMVCHLADSIRFALSPELEVDVMKGPPMFIRHLVRLYLPWPKGAPTVKEMLETDPATLANDILTLSGLMDELLETSDRTDWPVHPFFGPLDGNGWAKLGWRHMDHHLNQFGV